MAVQHEEFAYRIMVSKANRTEEISKRALQVLNEIKDFSPSDLELLSTIIYAAQEGVASTDPSSEGIVAAVCNLKGNKYADEHIHRFYVFLTQGGYI